MARATVYASIANGYQSGAFPARPYCLFADPDCFVAGDNITAVNVEVGVRGAIGERLAIAAAAFRTDYNLPYQISPTAGAGFDTRNAVLEQRTTGVEWEGSLPLGMFRLHTSLGWLNADFDDPDAAAPLTPGLTAAVSPELGFAGPGGGRVTLRVD